MKIYHKIIQCLIIILMGVGGELNAQGDISPSAGDVAKAIEQVAIQKNQIIKDIFRKVELAEKNDSMDVEKLCTEIRDATQNHLFDKTHVYKLIAIIQFPLTAKRVPASSGVFINPSDIQTPIGQALTMIGKDAADECLKEIGRSENYTRREVELYLVVKLAYGAEAEVLLRKELGSKIELFNKITNKE